MQYLILCTSICLVLVFTTATPKKIVCYFGAWSVYRLENGKFNIEGIDPNLCTHLVYSFVGVENNDIKIMDSWSDLPENLNGFGKFVNLRKKNPSVKVMVAIGGWNAGSIQFSKMASDPKQRKIFVENVIKFLQKYNFDGLDIDWEYPAQRGGAKEDIKNYVKLIKSIKKLFVKYDYLLSAAVAAPEPSAAHSYNIGEVSQYLDFINLMEYDFHCYSDGQTGMNAALFAASRESEDAKKLNVKTSVEYWLKKGAPKDKLILGIPAYGKSFTLSNPGNKGVGASASKAGNPGPYTKEAGMLGYNEICEMHKEGDWEIYRDKERGVPYAVKGDQWISFDDIETVKAKAEFIQSEGLGGAMIWSIDTDDFRGICGEKYPILKALNSVLNNEKLDKPQNPRASVTDNRKSNNLEKLRSIPRITIEDISENKNKQSTNNLSSSKNPSKCSHAGHLLMVPESCEFITCVPDGRGGLTERVSKCPSSLCFNEKKQVCDYKY